MKNLVQSLGCGILSEDYRNPVVYFRVTKLSDITGTLIPFFDKYPLQKGGSKRLDYADFCKVAQLMKNKAHLTAEGLEQIREIKAKMNTGRDNDSC
jgi:hypothetical protein